MALPAVMSCSFRRLTSAMESRSDPTVVLMPVDSESNAHLALVHAPRELAVGDVPERVVRARDWRHDDAQQQEARDEEDHREHDQHEGGVVHERGRARLVNRVEGRYRDVGEIIADDCADAMERPRLVAARQHVLRCQAGEEVVVVDVAGAEHARCGLACHVGHVGGDDRVVLHDEHLAPVLCPVPFGDRFHRRARLVAEVHLLLQVAQLLQQLRFRLACGLHRL